MNKEKIHSVFKPIALLLLYSFFFFYALTFPAAVSWFVFYFFTLLFLCSYLSTFFFLHLPQIQRVNERQDKVDLMIYLKTKNFLPILIPTLRAQITVQASTSAVEVPAFFKLYLQLPFSGMDFPRGRHISLKLQLKGKDFFGLFSHSSMREIPVSLDVYPKLSAKILRHSIIERLTSHLLAAQQSGSDVLELRQVREHREQDALKDIDWKTSLRRQQLMVKEYDKEFLLPLRLYFFGSESRQFEELLSLTYSLYQDLSKDQNVHLFLIGDFNNQTQMGQDSADFLSIKPSHDEVALKTIWENNRLQSGRKVIVAPESCVQNIQADQKETLFLLTEADLIMGEAK